MVGRPSGVIPSSPRGVGPPDEWLMHPAYDQPVNTSTDLGRNRPYRLCKKLNKFHHRGCTTMPRQAEFRVRSVLRGVSSYAHPVSASAMMGLK